MAKSGLLCFLFTLIAINLTLAQNGKWVNFTSGSITTIAEEGDYLWASNGYDLVKFNKTSGEKIFYNRCNSDLPNAGIASVVVDKKGMKWIGTRRGLVSFDGRIWTTYNTSNSEIPDNKIRLAALDGNGNKWIATDCNGMAKFDGENWTVYNKKNTGAPVDTVYSFSFDNKGNLWAITYGSKLVNFDGYKWSVINCDLTPYSDDFSKMTVDEKGNVWVATYTTGIIKYDGIKWISTNDKFSNIPGISISSISFTANGKLLIGYCGGYSEFDGSSLFFRKLPMNGKLTPTVASFYYDSSGKVWMGLSQGFVAVENGNDYTLFNFANSGLYDNYIRSIAIDSNGNKWLFTDWGLLCKFDDKSWTNLFSGQLGLLLRKYPLGVDKSGNKWLGCSNGLVKYNGIEFVVYDTSNSGLPDNDVNAIAVDKTGNIWAGTDNGLVKYDGQNWKTFDLRGVGFFDSNIQCLIADNSNNLWVCTNSELLRYDGENWIVLKNDLRPYFSTMALDNSGNVWISTIDGFLKYEGNYFTGYRCDLSGNTNKIITAMAFDNLGNLWAGSYNGLLKYDFNKWTLYTDSTSGLNSNTVTAIAADKNGNIWVGTALGLSMFSQNLPADNTYKNKYEYSISQNYPNPFNPTTTINYEIKQPGYVSLTVYDILGREVKTLVNGYQNPGIYNVGFNASSFSSGIYIYRLKAGNNYMESKKMVLLK